MDATSDTEDAAAAETLVPWAASQQRADGGKKPAVPSGRVWSEADEVRILEGLAAFTPVHGAEPRRSQLHAALSGCGLDKSEFTVTEIYEKVRRLRSKYANLRSAVGADKGDEACRYELSRSIWGDQPTPVPMRLRAHALAVEGITDDESLWPGIKHAHWMPK